MVRMLHAFRSVDAARSYTLDTSPSTYKVLNYLFLVVLSIMGRVMGNEHLGKQRLTETHRHSNEDENVLPVAQSRDVLTQYRLCP